MSEWKKINHFDPLMPTQRPFLLMDEYGHIYLGFTAFDYYEAEYWCELPQMPIENIINKELP